MGTEAARAAQHQEAADADFALSTETHEKADVDKAEGTTMQEQADALFVKADQDEAMAVREEAVADGEATKAAGEEEQAAGHFAEAGSLQTMVDADRVEAVAESVAASKAEFSAHGDELGTGLCEMIPVLDVVCDIIGGTAAVGLETTAAKDAAESAALIAAAVEAETKEEAEMALAVELQSAAAEDGELAAEGHTAATELETEAEAELTQAQEEEGAAQEKLDQSMLEEEATEEEQGQGVEEEAQSDASFAKSAQFGVAACWDACFATLVSVIAVGFFAVRFTSIIASSATTHLPTGGASNGASGLPLRWLGQVSLHCIVFAITLGYFGSSFCVDFDSLIVRARGGIILLFALSVTIAQTLLVHALPKLWSSNGTFVSRLKTCSKAFLWCVVCIFPLVIMEFLILRITFGRSLFTAEIFKRLHQWYMWIIFIVSLSAYYWFFERHAAAHADETKTVEVVSGGDIPSLNPSSSLSYGAVTDNKSLEASSLESVPLTSSVDTEQQTASTSRFTAIHAYFEQYQLPFDLLIAACAFAILRVCLPNVKHLWPISKTMILAAHPHWWIAAAACGTVVLIAAGAFCLCRKR